ncbi:helix-turn-helix domain-containing protein [Archangium violaceum]|uniref:helix-turn-helix domain-containing protein n=1 Tax=Archangium violaceum TaxID=83451 RepID=UPI00194EBABD|nr:helix-turn-helix domain-containing protein [Archangium violaceum]
MSCPQPRWVTIKEASTLAGCDEETVRRWCVEGRIHARKLAGSVWRIRIDKDNLPADPPEEEARAQ